MYKLLHKGAVALLMSVALTACPGPSGPPPGASGERGPGEACTADAQCQGGLSCRDGVCNFDRCTDAVDGQAFCAAELGVPASRVACETDGTCRKLRVGFGESCLGDEDCIFGSVCEDGVCVETCTSSASCDVSGEGCLERASGGERVCRAVSDCGQLEAPLEFCAERLGLDPGLVACQDGACEVLVLEPGFPCSFDLQCGEGAVCEPADFVGDVCTPTCEEDEECAGDDYKCLPRPSQVEAGKVCLFAPDPCDVHEAPDRHCSRRYGQPRRCNLETNLCEVAYEAFGDVRVMIEDRTTGEACRERLLGAQAPGIDLTLMALLYGSGLTQRAYARARYYEPKTPDAVNDYLSFGHVNGLPPEVDEAGCRVDGPDGASPIGSLGCGGLLIVEFVDEDGRLVLPRPGNLVTVFEFGQVCAERAETSAAADELELWWCGEQALGRVEGCLTPMRLVSGEGGLTTWAVEYPQIVQDVP